MSADVSRKKSHLRVCVLRLHANKNLFSLTSGNALKLLQSFPETKKIAGDFNVKKVFADDRILSNLGNLLCKRPFPRSNEIRFVNNFIYTKDYSGPNKDEVDAMPSECSN